MKLGIILRRELKLFRDSNSLCIYCNFLGFGECLYFYLGNFYERQQADLTPFLAFTLGFISS